MKLSRRKLALLAAMFVLGLYCLKNSGSSEDRTALAVRSGKITRRLYLMGGGNVQQCIDEFAKEVGNGKIVILPHASEFPQQAAMQTVDAFRKAGIKKLQILLPDSEDDIAEDAAGIFMTGGKQRLLSERLRKLLPGPRKNGENTLLSQLQRHYQEGKLVGGTSAGAAAVTKTMIAGWQKRHVPLLLEGLALVDDLVVDMHFDTYPDRAQRLTFCVNKLKVRGFGIPEGSGVYMCEVEEGGVVKRQLKVTGNSAVTFVTFKSAPNMEVR